MPTGMLATKTFKRAPFLNSSNLYPQPHLFTAPFDPQFYPATMSSEDFQTKQLEANPQGHTHPTYTTSGTDLGRATTIGGHPADSSQIGFPIQHRKLGSPLPLGLFAFATTTFA